MPHFDYIDPKATPDDIKRNGNRIATMLVIIKTAKQGGSKNILMPYQLKIKRLVCKMRFNLNEINVGSNLVVTYLFPRVARFSNATQKSDKCETHLQDITGTNIMTDISSNDGSIVLFARYKQVTLLLMGDLETTGELTLSCLGLLEPMTIVKVGHHGSKSSSSMEFVSQTQPEYAVISVGKNNRFGHPSPEVVSRYDLFRSVLLRTDLMGSIELLSDGGRVWREKSLFDK